MKYKQKLIEKVLNHDLQSANFNATKPVSKSPNDKDGKKLTAKGVAAKR